MSGTEIQQICEKLINEKKIKKLEGEYAKELINEEVLLCGG